MTHTTKFSYIRELAPTWSEAEKALVQFKQTRLPTDRENAILLLQPLCYRIALALTGFEHMDQKLFGAMRRSEDDKKDLARDASNSVLLRRRKSGASGISVIAAGFDPERRLDTYVFSMVANKLLDYLRQEPIKGLIGPKVAPKAAPNLRSFYAHLRGSGSGGEEAAHAIDWDTGAPSDTGEADSYIPIVFSEVLEVLTEEEREVAYCEIIGLTQVEACAELCRKHGPQPNGEPYIKRGAYRYRLEETRRKLLEAFPELKS